MARQIVIVAYEKAWLSLFEIERRLLREIFGDTAEEIHHFGSTSVAGLASKPVLDILIAARDLKKVDALNSRMRQNRYVPQGEYGIPGRRYFVKIAPENPDIHTHHVHVYQTGDPKIAQELLFRDRLRADAALLKEYEDIKLRLADRYRFDPDAYTDAKSGFIRRVLAEDRTAI